MCSHAGTDLTQLGVVEYELTAEGALPTFRAPLGIVEPEFLEVEQAHRLDAMGVTL